MIKKMVSELSAFQKVAATVLTILVAVFTSGMYFSGVLGLPESVEALETQTEFIRTEQIKNFSEHAMINSRLDKILCNQNPEMTWDQCELRYGGGDQ